jgi:hypothetical protein
VFQQQHGNAAGAAAQVDAATAVDGERARSAARVALPELAMPPLTCAAEAAI